MRRLPKARRAELQKRRRSARRRRRRILELAIELLHHGACARPNTGWSHAEAEHNRARNRKQALRAANKVSDYCVTCPVVEACATWAELEEYDGLAAGAKWINGVPYTLDSTSKRLRPLRQQSGAA